MSNEYYMSERCVSFLFKPYYVRYFFLLHKNDSWKMRKLTENKIYFNLNVFKVKGYGSQIIIYTCTREKKQIFFGRMNVNGSDDYRSVR